MTPSARRWGAVSLVLVACATPAPRDPPTPAASDPRGASIPEVVRASLAPLAGSEPTARPSPLPDECTRTEHTFEQPIAVADDTGLERWPPVLAFPIAFPRAARLSSLSGFFASTAGGPRLPAQLEVLSRWGDGPDACDAPIRWAYTFVLGELAPGARGYLSLRHEPGELPAMKPAIEIEEDEAQLTVDTGPARFTVRRDWFNGLSRVELRGPGGWRTIADVPSTGDAGMLVDTGRGLASPIFGRRLALELERRGPNVATLVARGTYATRDHADVFRYTLRLHFYAGTGVVAVDHTYYNGETTDHTARGGRNLVRSARVLMRIPLLVPSSPGELEVTVRGHDRLHRVTASAPVELAQHKRSPERPEPRFSILHGREVLEEGAFAEQAMVAAAAGGVYAAATIGFLSARDPQGLRVDAGPGARPALELLWQSEPLQIGGARGIWSKAVLDFGDVATVDLPKRGHQLYAHATRPLLGVPSVEYLNTTRAFAPLPGELPAPLQALDRDLDRVHDTTRDHLRRYRITGTQLWPDLPRTSCRGVACTELERGYFEGGDDNYWDWSLVELTAFLRTGDPAFVHDFALGEAMTMAETISFRTNPWSRASRSSFGGFSPCYGGGRGEDGVWSEGLNHRMGTCPGDYSYNKVHYLAYLLTADRRFLELFEEGAETALRMYKDPPRTRPDRWLELSASRTTYQYLEPLLCAAELSRAGSAVNRRYRDRALAYFEHMRTRALERGHTCNLLGSGEDDPKLAGECTSDQAWMLPPWIEWVSRLAELYDVKTARAWLREFAETNTRRHTVAGDTGLPDLSREAAGEGWRTTYRCKASRRGVLDDTCERVTEMEHSGRFYPNGMVAYLSALGVVLGADPSDPAGLCAWLPEAYAEALARMDTQTNGYVWGKELGQAYALAQQALGAITKCKSR